MRISRVFFSEPGPLVVGQSLTLTDKTYHYLARVLRVREGQQVLLFDGSGFEYQVVVEQVTRREIRATVWGQLVGVPPSPVSIALYLALSRGERMDYALQKTTELGVDVVHLVQSQFCTVQLTPERQNKRMQHWQQVVVSASEQSGRSMVPKLVAPKLFSQLEPVTYAAFVADPGARETFNAWSDKLSAPKNLAILVGPEGGLSDQEITLANDLGFVSLAMGPRIMRTETAAAITVASVQMRWGDMR